jgi:hypothetical protein
MAVERTLRVGTSTSVREKRLATLLQGRDPRAPELLAAVEEAQLLGSLELAGVSASAEDVQAARAGGGPATVSALLAARHAVAPDAPFGVSALVTWHRTLFPPGGFRTTPRPESPVSAPVPFIESRLAILEQWLATESRRELKPSQAGALVLARVMEILPFEQGNGRVARLAAAHVMVQSGARPPILIGTDGPRLVEALQAAFQLATEPLAALLDEAADRSLDVMIRTLA